MQVYKKVLLIVLASLTSLAFADGDYTSDEYFNSIAPPKKTNPKNEIANRAPTFVYPGKLQSVIVSNTDVNLIQCEHGIITDRTYSEEKPLIYQVSEGGDGSASFIKFLKQNVNGEELLYTKQVELYVTCGGQIYSMMLTPEAIPTQHVILSGGKSNSLKSNISMFKELDLEDAAITLIDKVQFETILPDSFSQTMADPYQPWAQIIPTVKARLVRSVKPEGVGLIIHEYLVFSEVDQSLNEFDFVKLRLNTFALRLSNLNIQSNGTVRAFLVERLWR